MTLDGFTGSAGVALDTAINRAIPGEYHPTINARFVQTVEDYTKGNTSQDQLSALRDELLDQAADQRSQAARVLELCELSRRRSLLALLARRAELLAARERELRDAIVVVALKAIGAATGKLDKSIREAEAQFEDSQSGEATVAHAARQKLADGKVIAHAGEVAGELTRNLLARHLDQPGKLGSVASTLDEVAVILCRRPVFGEMKVIAKESERHIRRQTETNANITAKIRNQVRAPSRTELFSKQEQLRREVPEGASALHCLARQLIGFESATADKLDAAAKEMDMGLSDLDRAACPKALEHGERTLGLLRDAREHFDAKMIQRHLGRYRQLARRVGVAATQMAVSRISRRRHGPADPPCAVEHHPASRITNPGGLRVCRSRDCLPRQAPGRSQGAALYRSGRPRCSSA